MDFPDPFPREVKEGSYRRAFVGRTTACAENEEGRLECWGGQERLFEASPEFERAVRPGAYRDIVLDDVARSTSGDWFEPPFDRAFYATVLTEDGRVRWFSTTNSVGPADEYPCSLGPASLRSFTGSSRCIGLDDDGNLHADERALEHDPLPEGRYRTVVGSVDGGFACAIRLDSELVCWSLGGIWGLREWDESWPRVRVKAVDLELKHACVLLESGEPLCWNDGTFFQDSYREPPKEALRELCVGFRSACGITEKDGAIRCWGRDDEFTVPPPELDGE